MTRYIAIDPDGNIYSILCLVDSKGDQTDDLEEVDSIVIDLPDDGRAPTVFQIEVRQ